MKRNNLHIIPDTKKKGRFLWDGNVVIQFCLILLIYFSFGMQIFAGQNALVNKNSTQRGNAYYLQNSISRISVSQGTTILLKANIKLQSDIKGEGDIVLSSRREIILDASDNRINNLIIDKNTSVKLNGNLKILRRVRILDKGEIALGDFDLIFSSSKLLDSESRNRIIETGIGRLVEQELRDDISVLNTNTISINNFHPSSDMLGIEPVEKIEYSYNMISNQRNLFQIYIETDSPPPR